MSDYLEGLTKFFGGMVLTIAGIFFFVIFGTLFGALAGYIVGLVFGDAILGVLHQLGIRSITMWQYGAFLGFTGGYLKTKVTAEVKMPKAKS